MEYRYLLFQGGVWGVSVCAVFIMRMLLPFGEMIPTLFSIPELLVKWF